jgi:hypothetical protein
LLASGDAFVIRGLAQDCDKTYYNGISMVLIFQVKINASNSKMEIEKFNGKISELWKLNMEYLLVDIDQWITVDLGSTPTGTLVDDWKTLDQKTKSTI